MIFQFSVVFSLCIIFYNIVDIILGRLNYVMQIMYVVKLRPDPGMSCNCVLTLGML